MTLKTTLVYYFVMAASLFGGRHNAMLIMTAQARPTAGAFMSSLASLLSKQQTSCRHHHTTLFLRSGRLRPVTFVGLTTTARNMTASATSTKNNDDDEESTFDFDYFVIGGGSGGIASARRAATYGAKVAVAEGGGRLGGTCVNVGCVPKKVMWNAATIAEIIHEMNHYGFSVSSHEGEDNDITFDWKYLKQARDKYIKRLNGIYERNLENSGVEKLFGVASLEDLNTVRVQPADGGESVIYTAKHILIAVGGKPSIPPGEGIREHSISSDGFFELEELPRKAVVVGAGFIAVE